jgi:hypothetical protein
MTKFHAGTHLPRTLNRGAKSQPATTSGGFHGGTLLVKGEVHAGTPPRVYSGNHGGTALPMGVLSGKKRK